MRLLFVAILFVFSLPAFAQNATFEVDLSNCRADAEKLCTGDEASSSQAVIACLQTHIDTVSAPCQGSLKHIGAEMEKSVQALRDAVQICTPDLDKHCMAIKGTKANPITCLKKYESSVSNKCLTALKETGLWEIADNTAVN